MTAFDATAVGGWLRLLCLLLTVWEPLSFAASAAGAMNAVQVRGIGVAAVLAAKLAATALCVAAGRALFNRQQSGMTLARLALGVAAGAHLLALLGPWFPSNRMPGDTPIHAAFTVAYYGGWLVYLSRSKRVAATYA